jgi:ArsR family transcriptional regulator
MKELETAGLIETEKEGKFVKATFRRKVWKRYLGELKGLLETVAGC